MPIARDLAELGFRLIATRGTAAYLRAYGLDVDVVFKVNEGRPNIADEIVNRKVDLVVNTPLGRESFFDDRAVRRAAMMHEVPCITTLTGAAAAVSAIRAMREQGVGVRALQDYYAGIAAGQACSRSADSSRPRQQLAHEATKTRRPTKSLAAKSFVCFVSFVPSWLMLCPRLLHAAGRVRVRRRHSGRSGLLAGCCARVCSGLIFHVGPVRTADAASPRPRCGACGVAQRSPWLLAVGDRRRASLRGGVLLAADAWHDGVAAVASRRVRGARARSSATRRRGAGRSLPEDDTAPVVVDRRAAGRRVADATAACR